MGRLTTILKKAGSISFGALLLIGVGCLLAMLCFCMPVALVFESVDLVLMDSKTQGIVSNVEQKTHRSEASTLVTYTFEVDGTEIRSTRVFPGFLGNKGGYTGSGKLARQFPAGQQCEVYFDASNPSRCALMRGWFCWSVAFTAAVWGIFLSWVFQSRSRVLFVFARAFLFYGFGLIFVGPLSVDLADLHWHLVALLSIATLVAVHQFMASKTDRKADYTSRIESQNAS
ncbi:MAG: DUF3592 domain-containing protein [Planctomycetota bacterium]